MEQKQILGFLQSFIIIPFLATTLNFGTLIGVSQADADGLMNSIQSKSTVIVDPVMQKEASLIDEYFSSRELPLAGMGMKIVEVAKANDLDWRLIAAIAMRESTGGLHACKSVDNNYWGWHSCKSGFLTLDIAIEEIGAHLGGNNERTDQYYAGKSTEQILKTYNPDSIIPGYSKQVMKIMNTIGPEVVSA